MMSKTVDVDASERIVNLADDLPKSSAGLTILFQVPARAGLPTQPHAG
jgi:hypothetical protein